MIKKIFLAIFLYIVLFLLSIFTLYLYISFSFTEEVSWVFSNIKDINNIIIFLYIVLLIFLFFILRKREKYIFITTWSFFIIFIIGIITFYFGYFKKYIFELVDIPDEKFITKYQNTEIKDEKNIYTYLFHLRDSAYKSNTFFEYINTN